MARLSRRKDATRWPRMSSTFWAVLLLTALLLLYCGKSVFFFFFSPPSAAFFGRVGEGGGVELVWGTGHRML